MERLEHALFVFRESEPYRVRRNFDAPHLEEYLRKHNTRARGTARFVKKPEVWEKSDNSTDGEYDPSKNKKKACKDTMAKSKKPRKPVENEGEEKPKVKKATTSQGARKPRMYNTFRLESDEGRAFLRNLAEKDPKIALGLGVASADVEEFRPTTPSIFQGTRLNLPDPSPAQKLAVRRAIGDKWDAFENRDSTVCGDRKLRSRIIPKKPKLERGRCKPCKHQKRRCSQKVAHGCPRKNCAKHGAHCFFGSDEDEKCMPIESWDVLNHQTVQKEQLKEPRPSQPTGDGITQTSAIVISTPSPALPPETRPLTIHTPQPAGRAKVIITDWAHPIDFMFHPAPNSAAPRKLCHFCADYRYGIQGCGQVQVEVIQRTGTVKYEEMGNGNVARGFEPTRMCIICALHRLHIAECPKHELKPLPLNGKNAPDPAKLDYQQWMTQLADKRDSREKQQVHPCCSLCHSPASFMCCASTHDLKVKGLFSGGYTSTRKCRLWLCAECEAVVGRSGWKKNLLLQDIERRKVAVRADLEFLFPRSDLHKAWGVGEQVMDWNKLKTFK